MLYIIVGLAVTLAVVFGILQIILEKDFYYAWMGLIFATAVVVCGIYMKIQNDLSEIQVAERSQNRAIVLLNKVKLKYINVANAVDYACEKYHVKVLENWKTSGEYYLGRSRNARNIREPMRIWNILTADWCACSPIINCTMRMCG